MRTSIAVVFLLATLNSFSQTYQGPRQTVDQRDLAKNEMSIGALNLVAFGALELTYERILSPNTSWALEGFVLALNRENEDLSDAYRKDFSLTGKFKYFFSEHTASGFYVSGLSMVSTGKYEEDNREPGEIDNEPEQKKYTDLALGFGIGAKLVSRQGFFVDLSAGIGRNLFNSNAPTIIGQFGLHLGYRF